MTVANNVFLTAPSDANVALRPKTVREYLNAKMGRTLLDDFRDCSGNTGPESKRPRYQWFWAGTQKETEVLTPDLKHSVKRHVSVKRVIPIDEFPVDIVKRARDQKAKAKGKVAAEMENNAETSSDVHLDQAILLRRILNFSFSIQVSGLLYLALQD
jgi:hypothetical protein